MYVIITGLASIIIVAILKSQTIYECPYNTIDLGGTAPHYNILNKFPFGKTNGNCFPAGHASGPYSLVSFYFFALKYNPKYTKISLAIPIILGLVFDVSQQLRGAHFVTHGMFTLAICWICSVYGYKYILNNK